MAHTYYRFYSHFLVVFPYVWNREKSLFRSTDLTTFLINKLTSRRKLLSEKVVEIRKNKHHYETNRSYFASFKIRNGSKAQTIITIRPLQLFNTCSGIGVYARSRLALFFVVGWANTLVIWSSRLQFTFYNYCGFHKRIRWHPYFVRLMF